VPDVENPSTGNIYKYDYPSLAVGVTSIPAGAGYDIVANPSGI
jgi:hypothetical protein